MIISNLGRLIGAGLLALGLNALVPGVAAGDAAQQEADAKHSSASAGPSARKVDVAINRDASAPTPAPQP